MLIEALSLILSYNGLKSVHDFRRESQEEKIRQDQGLYTVSVKEKPLTGEEKNRNYWKNVNANAMGPPKAF